MYDEYNNVSDVMEHTYAWTVITQWSVFDLYTRRFVCERRLFFFPESSITSCGLYRIYVSRAYNDNNLVNFGSRFYRARCQENDVRFEM